ncbi:MAG: aminotransferase class I/II-fold pyridoxal phosphate-dependent enzyme [Steroidobacteraceae bacterium]
MKPETQANHPPAVELPADNHAVVPPIYQSVKFEFDTVDDTLGMLRGERAGFYYSRSTNPTLRQLELTLAQLQGREAALVCASGVGAIAQTLLGLTRQGDHILCFLEGYGPTRQLIRRVLGRYGITHTMLSITAAEAGIEAALAAQPTRLVMFESPTNPANRIADIALLTRLARKHGALTVLDNTFAGPHQHGQFDIDLFVHSLTKFAGGHGDVLGGAVIGSETLIRALRPEFSVLGGALDPHAAFLIQRGLKSYFVRYRAQCANARALAQYLEQQPMVERVSYPGLATHPQHALAAAQMSDFGSVISFDLKGGARASQRCAEALQLFAIAASLGSTESLVLPSQLLASRDLSAEQQAASGLLPGTVRLSVGLEAVEDLIADLQQALVASQA